MVLCCRGTRSCKRSTARCLRCCFGRRPTEAPRQIQGQGVARVLDLDSESEAEAVSDPCEAVLVGLELQGKPRALAPEGCEDRAATPLVFLMTTCSYPTWVGGSVLGFATVIVSSTCFLARGGNAVWFLVSVRFMVLIGELPFARSIFPKQVGLRARPLHLGAQAQNLRSPSSNLFADLSRLKLESSRMVRFVEQSRTSTEPMKSRTASEYELPSKAERSAHPKAGAPVLVRLRPVFGTGSTSGWYLFLGEVEGISEDSRRTERASLLVHSLGVRITLPWHCLGEPPQTHPSGRYPKAWLRSFSTLSPRNWRQGGFALVPRDEVRQCMLA